MKNCEYYEELISCLVDGEITDEEKAELEEHLKDCASCRELYSTYSALFGGAELADPPEELLPGVMDRIRSMPIDERDAQDKPAAKKKTYIVFRYIAAAAACVALAMFAVPRLKSAGNFAAQKSDSAAPEAAYSTDSADGAEENAAEVPGQESFDANGVQADIHEADLKNSSAAAKEYGAELGMPVIMIYGELPDYLSADTSEPLEDGVLLIKADADTVNRLVNDGYTFEPETDDGERSVNEAAVIFIP